MAASKLDRAKTQLICHYPFFGTILLQGGITPRTDIPTACVNARGEMFYNPDFVESLAVDELVGLLAHETLHKVCLHLLRQGPRDLQRWNIATDWWINETLHKEGFVLPEGALRHEGAETETAEVLYTRVPEQPPGGGGATQQDLLPGDAPLTPEEAAQVEAATKVLVASATQAAKLAGKLSQSLARVTAGLVHSTVPWWQVLEHYMQARVTHDSSWARPNRRYAPDYYLPSASKQPGMGPLTLVVDVSGSITSDELAQYNGHLQRIIADVRPTQVDVLYTDTQVQRHDTFEEGEPVELTHYSGGGTDMEAAFTYSETQQLAADVTVVLTDGHTPFRRTQDTRPLVWLITTAGLTAPYGTTIHAPHQ